MEIVYGKKNFFITFQKDKKKKFLSGTQENRYQESKKHCKEGIVFSPPWELPLILSHHNLCITADIVVLIF